MSRAEKVLEAMRRDPAGDFRMGDSATVCKAFDIDCVAPSRGSHFRIAHASAVAMLTIPARRPIKPVYIRAFVVYIDDLRSGTSNV